MKNKKIIIILILVIVIILIASFTFFRGKMSKNLKIGNNTTSQEIVNYILSINSYETKVEVEVKSNKNSNKYIIKQKYNGIEDNSQEVIEPNNIAGVKIIKEGKNLRLENSNLNLTSMFENYQYISDNSLDLCSFIEDYKKGENSEWKEKDGKIIMETNRESKQKILYIDAKSGNPEKMKIKDNNKNIAVYILYKEVSVNS